MKRNYLAIFSPYFLTLSGLVLIASRLPFRGHFLYHWDSVQFALGLSYFDPALHRPHPPGYILYIALGRLVNLFVHDANLALIILSIFFSLVGLVALFYLARSISGWEVAYLAALLYLFNPLVWFHGEVALMYMAEAALVSLFLFFLYNFYANARVSQLWVAVAVLIFLGGVRQSALLFMVPILLYVLIVKNRRLILPAFGLLAAGVLAWWLPLLHFSGGLLSYLKLSALQVRNTVGGNYAVEGWYAVGDNLFKIIRILWSSLGFGLVLLAIGVLPYLMPELKGELKVDRKKLLFWLWALLPGVVFLSLTLVTNPGYLLFLVVPLSILIAESILLIGRFLASAFQKMFLPALVIVGVLFLMVWGGYRFFTVARHPDDFINFSYLAIKGQDEFIGEQISYIKQNFNPKETIIWVEGPFIWNSLRHYQYYLPNYPVYEPRLGAIPYDKDDYWWYAKNGIASFRKEMLITPDMKQILVIRRHWGGIPIEFDGKTLPSGRRLMYYDLSRPSVIDYLKDLDAVKVELRNDSNEEEKNNIL